MKTQIYLAVFFISIITLHAQPSQIWNNNGTLTVSNPETFTSQEMDFNVEEVFSLDKDSNWGIKGTLSGTDSYIKLKILFGDDDKLLGAIRYNTPPVGKKYSHESLFYYECAHLNPSVFDFAPPMTQLTTTSCYYPVWQSNNIATIYFQLKQPESQIKSILLNNKVTLVLEVKNATVQEIYIPGLGKPKTPRMLFDQRKGVVVYVDRDSGSTLPSYYDFTVASSDNSASKTFDNMVDLTSGDRVSYEVYGNAGNTPPTIKGLPKIWVSGYAAQREFITTPDYGPNQYEPWIAFEAQTHFRMINSYPKSFEESGIKSKDWKDQTLFKSWDWVAQRSTDPNLDKYKPVVYYPKTRKFFIDGNGNYKYQRESQALGWSKQLMEYYDEYCANSHWNDLQCPSFNREENYVNAREKYLTGFDVDEFLYVGSKTAGAAEVSKWITDAKNEISPYTNPNILSVHNYKTYSNPGTSPQNTNNWQTLWDSEKNYPSTDSDNTVVYCIPENSTYPMVWDSRGFPRFGFQLNDMVTRYQRYKSLHSGDPKTKILSRNDYYNGYEIQDVASHYKLENGSKITISSLDGTPLPCAEGCWFNGNEGGANVKHPGKISFIINTSGDNMLTVNFKQKVTDPIDNDSNTKKGFYSSLQATDQWVMGWGNNNTWTLQGVTSEEMAKRISLVMLKYDVGNGMMLPEITKRIADGSAIYNATNHTLSATFEVYSSWMAIAAYYQPKDGKDKDKVIIAGRADMVMDPPTSLTVPGSTADPYAGSIAETLPEGSLDFNEGQGDRAFETMNEVRSHIDPGRGYVHQLGYGYTKYVREYNIVKGNKLTFSCLDVGRKIQSFWPNNNEDPYQSWREMAKRMPSSEAATRLEWKVFKI